jgi:hypothetical protein
MLVFPYKRLSAEIVTQCPDGWAIGKFDQGWMTGETFFEFMANVYETMVIKKQYCTTSNILCRWTQILPYNAFEQFLARE